MEKVEPETHFKCSKCGKKSQVTRDNIQHRADWNVPYPENKLCSKCSNEIKYLSEKCVSCDKPFKLTYANYQARQASKKPLNICSDCLLEQKKSKADNEKPRNHVADDSSSMFILNYRKLAPKDFTIFEPGQVWFWEDPVCGRKGGTHDDVVRDMGRMHYSRYVVILQSESTIAGSRRLLIAPFSTSQKSGIRIKFISESETYIQCANITTVDTANFTKFIAKLSPSVMESIEKGVLFYLAPSYYAQLPEDQKLDIVYVDQYPDNNSTEVRSFVKLVEETNRTQGTRAWTPELKLMLVNRCDDIGMEAVAKELNLAVSSIRSNYYRWRKELMSQPAEVTLTVPSKPEPKVESHPINISGIPNAISFISNVQKQQCVKAGVFDQIKDHFRSASHKILAAAFYDQLQDAIYQSYLKYLSISQLGKGSVGIPVISQNDPHSDTWKLLSAIHNDPRVGKFNMGDGNNLAIRLKEVLGENSGINSDWLPVLMKEIENKTSLLPSGSKLISSMLGEIWCSGYPNSNRKPTNGNSNVITGNAHTSAR